MKNCSVKWIALFILLVVLTVGLLLLMNRTPSYAGKSLGFWLSEVGEPQPRQGQAIQAFQAMGTNAVPYLVKLLNYRKSYVGRLYESAWLSLPQSVRQRVPEPASADTIRSSACDALQYIGLPARMAVRDLVVLLGDSDVKVRLSTLHILLQVLNATDAFAVPPLVELAKDRDEIVGGAPSSR